jgi:hypothetical protein
MEAANGAAEPQGGTTMDLPQAQETLMVTPTTRPWRARALAVIAALLARAADLNRETDAAFVELHPDDAGRLGLADGAAAELDFGEDRTAHLPVRVTTAIAPGCLFVPANQPDLPLRALLGPAPALPVTVRPVKEAAA